MNNPPATSENHKAVPLSISPLGYALVALVAVGLGWAYWPALCDLVLRWWWESQYSHGFLVPAFAVFLLVLRRDKLDVSALRPNWWGLAIILGGLTVWAAGAYLYFNWFDDLSLLISLAGLCVLAGGWAAFRWAWPAIAFLIFMVPLPYFVETSLAYPLRITATETSTFTLQLLGFPTYSEGTDIHLYDAKPLQVAPACSGLGMLLVFFTLSTAIVLVIDRWWVEKVIILMSSVPIAIISNIVRIVITALLFQVSAETAHKFFHDWAGYLMPPIALVLLGLELKLLGYLFVKVETSPKMGFDFTAKDSGRRRVRPAKAKA